MNDIAIVREEMARLREKHGHVTADMLLEASRSKRNPMHKIFRWDDDEGCAMKWRRHMAHSYIVKLKVEPVVAKELNLSVDTRAYHGRLGGGYHHIEDIVNDDERLKRLKANCRRDWKAFKRKYDGLSQLEPEMEAMSAAVERIAPTPVAAASR